MATYYIRGGSSLASDSNSGLSPLAPWLTFTKALGAAGISSGDTVYVGAAIYRETFTVNMTSATVETKIIGDVDGSHTGDPGEVILSAYTSGDLTLPISSNLCNLNGKSFLTFQNINLISQGACVVATTATSTNITLYRCKFLSTLNTAITATPAANTALVWVIDSCRFLNVGNPVMSFTLTRPATADFDVNVIIKNCMETGATSGGISIVSTGANTFKAGGVLAYNCSKFSGGNFMNVGDANISTTIPCKVYNCFISCAGNVALAANLSGQIVEDYNIFNGGSANTNVTAGSHSIQTAWQYAPLFYSGHEFIPGGASQRPYGMPMIASTILSFGNQSGSPTTDILGAPRPSGSIKFLDSGTATSGAAKTLTDLTATWGVNILVGATIKITGGTGSGQTKSVDSNTATVITVDGNWKTNPDSTSTYYVYYGSFSTSGTATAGTTTTLTDGNAAWGVNMWAGYTLKIDGGTGSGQSLIVVSNTATILTFAVATAPDATSTYKLYRGTDENTVNPGVGCFELGNTGIKETVLKRTESSLRIAGPGYHDFTIPVDGVSTTVAVYVQWDSNYAGTKPSLNIINGTECGVADATATAVGSAGAWEQLSLSFTPNATGVVTMRLISSCTTPTGNAYFDERTIN